jgi:tRNA threonylcarbamoyladenosine biosynthesis protein TsaB
MPRLPVILAIETSQRSGSVALRSPGGTIHVEHLISARRHDDDLMPAIDRLFARLELKPDALEVVAVSIGPGGFTGLRIAVATAKMFAEVLGARVIAVPSAMVAAESIDPIAIHATESQGEIVIALASKGETFWSTRFRRQYGLWREIGSARLVDASSRITDGLTALVGDEYLPVQVQAMCREAGVPLVRPAFSAIACLRVSERMAQAAEFTDPLALLPLYPRQPEAVSIWEARQGGARDSR